MYIDIKLDIQNIDIKLDRKRDRLMIDRYIKIDGQKIEINL